MQSNAASQHPVGTDMCSLTRAQNTVLMLAKRGDSFFFSGAAGTGKTFTLRTIIDALPQSTTFVTAMTGIASSLLPNGSTLHSFAGIGLGGGSNDQLLNKVKKNAKAVNQWKRCTTLIIDEVSMLSKDLFELLDLLGREIRGRKTIPFGGIQLICCGDFFQLPPVTKAAVASSLPTQPQSSYCFESPLWEQVMGENSFELLEIFRQKDQHLISLLNDVRYGETSPGTLEMVNFLRRDIRLPSGIQPTMLVPVNAIADSINMRELQKLPAKDAYMYQCSDWGIDPYALDLLPKVTLFPEKLPIRIGAQVMLLKNHAEQKLWNGSRGVVVRFVDQAIVDKGTMIVLEGTTSKEHLIRFPKLPLVRFGTGDVEAVICPDAFELESFGKSGGGSSSARARRVQLPLRLSWAITIHKSQGMSLDYLKVDCSKSFEAGQAYVALSRARSLEGLQILSFDARKCWCDPTVVDFYKNRILRLTDSVCEEIMEKGASSAKRKRTFTAKKSEPWIHEPFIQTFVQTTYRLKQPPPEPIKEAHELPTSATNPLMKKIVSAMTSTKGRKKKVENIPQPVKFESTVSTNQPSATPYALPDLPVIHSVPQSPAVKMSDLSVVEYPTQPQFFDDISDEDLMRVIEHNEERLAKIAVTPISVIDLISDRETTPGDSKSQIFSHRN